MKVDKDGRPEGTTSCHKAGTLPFMAYELLEDMHAAEIERRRGIEGTSRIVRCLRLDFQSVALVCLWCAIMLLPKKIKTSAHTKPKANSLGTLSTDPTLNSHTITAPERQSDEITRYDAYLRGWEEGSYCAMAAIKNVIINNARDPSRRPLSPLFEHLSGWFEAFLTPFAEGIARWNDFQHYVCLKKKDDRA